MLTLPSPCNAEILAAVGFDWFFIDGEHSPLAGRDLVHLFQAVAGRTACLVRVPQGDEGTIKNLLDLGADGVIVPQVNSAEQAADIVKYCRYPPEGARGVGLGRAQGYGFQFQQYVDSANDVVTVIIQAEHIRAVENIEAIVAVEGIDAIQLGPYDLAASMGKMGRIDDPQVTQAIDHVIDTCQRAKLPVGYFGVDAAAVRPLVERGCTLIVADVDSLMLGRQARQTLAALRQCGEGQGGEA